VLSLISFTFRPGLSAPQTVENENDTLGRNSSNMTTLEILILKSLQSSDLSKMITNSFTTAFTSNFKSSLNVTQESLEKIQLQVTSNITSALKNILFLILNNNEGIHTPDETAIHTPWYTDSPENASSYFTDMYNRNVLIDVDSTAKTIISSITLPKFNNHNNWCVAIL